MPPRPADLDAFRSLAERALAEGSAPDGTFTAEAVSSLEAAAGAADRPRRVRALARFAAEGHLSAASADDLATVQRVLGAPLVAGPDGPTALRAVDALLAAEPDADRRADLQRARLRTLASHVVEPLRDAGSRRDEAARALGADSPRDLVARVADIPLDPPRDAARAILDGSADAWHRARDVAGAGALGERRGRPLEAADLPRLGRAPQHDGTLAPDGARAAVVRTLDLLDLRGGDPAPDPLPGLVGYAAGLRAAGMALARAGASSRLPVESRLLGDPALTRAHGLLLEGLPAEPAWLARVLGIARPEGVAATARAIGLLGLRAACARVLGPTHPEAMSDALGIDWPEELRAADGLGGLDPIDDLRARMLAAALRAHLHDGFGERWFAEPRAGALLAEIWLEGGDLDPAALAEQLGAPGLGPAQILEALADAPAP